MKMFSSMITIVDGVMDKGLKFYRNRWIRLATQILVLGICSIFVYRYSSDIINVAGQLRINAGRVLLSWFILSIIYLFIGTTSWWCILKGLGESPGWITSAHIQLTSTLAKYVPGYIWQYVGKAVMSKEMGITSFVSGTAMALELGQTLLLGAGIAFLTFSTPSSLGIGGLEKIQKVAFPFGILIILGSVITAWIFPFIAPKAFKAKPLRPEFLFASVILITMGWFMLSFSFWLLGTSLTPLITAHDLQTFVFATSLSIVTSILFLLAPNGLGVREGVLVFVLGSVLSIPLAIVFAAAARLLVTICELSSAFLMSLYHRYDLFHKKDPF